MKVITFLLVIAFVQAHVKSNLKDPSNKTCLGRCKDAYIPADPCQCNSQCSNFGNCCPDYEEICTSCINRCGLGVDQNYGCQCNDACKNFNDCCNDYDEQCSSTGVSDEELQYISELLYLVDFNSVGEYVVINPQSESSSCSLDTSYQPVFQSVDNAHVLTKPTFAAFFDLQDNYNQDATVAENRTPEEMIEEEVFLDSVLDTLVMQSAIDFMTSKGLYSGDFKEMLQRIWFGQYDRDGTSQEVVGSSGFEHVFMGETRGKDVIGFHNWYSFYRQELLGNINYMGYIDKTDFGAPLGQGLSMVFTWNDKCKSYGSMPVGFSPELELSLYTICFFARPDSKCKMTLNGLPIVIQTYKQIFKGTAYVGTAYPDWQ